MKICDFCHEERNDEDFLISRTSGNRVGRCKPCRTKYNLTRKKYRQKRYAENREEIIKKSTEYAKQNRQRITQRNAERRKNRSPEEIAKDRLRYRNLSQEEKKRQGLRRYGLTLEEYNQMFANQGYRCVICGSDDSKSKLDFCVDHCHNTGKVRGILCHGCNKGIGYFEDNLNNLESAIKYLRGHI